MGALWTNHRDIVVKVRWAITGKFENLSNKRFVERTPDVRYV